MKIKTRLTLIIISQPIIFAIIVIFVSLLPLYYTYKSTEQQKLTSHAIMHAHLVSELIQEKIDVAKTLSLTPTILASLEKSNKAYVKFGKKRDNIIASQNKLWKKGTKKDDIFVEKIMKNTLSSFLKRYSRQFAGKIGEIFITNKFGAVIATTAKLTTFAHSHKYWWRASYYEGKGRIFLDDRGFDKSANKHVLGIVVPVFNKGEIVGLLKSNISIIQSLKKVSNLEEHNTHVRLFREKGQVLLEKDKEPLSTKIDDRDYLSLVKSSYLRGVDFGNFACKKNLYSFALVSITSGSNEIGFGGSKESIDHIMGNTQEKWYIDVRKNINKAAASFFKTTIILLSIILFLINLSSGKNVRI